DYLKKLETEASGDPALESEIAGGYVRLGEIQGGLRSDNLGDPKAALESYNRALAIRQAHMSAMPGDMETELNVARTLIRIGDVLGNLGQFDEALDRYEEANTLT